METIELPLTTRPVRACRRSEALPTPPVTPPLASSSTAAERPKPLRARSTPAQKISPQPSDGLSSVSLPVTRAPSPKLQPAVVITETRRRSASPRAAAGYDAATAARMLLPRRGSALGLDLEESEGTPATTTAQLLTPDTSDRTPKRMSINGRPRCRSERRFTCPHPGCQKAYYKPSRLQEHILTHTGERPHVCEVCGQSYFRHSHLTAHMRVHKDEGEKRFECPREGCGKRFWTQAHCRRHEESHDCAEQHKCEQCEAVFAKSHALRAHVAEVHMPPGTKPWLCGHEGCGKSFAMKQQLRTHERTHDPSRYTCSHPDHDTFPVFANWTELQAHIREAHPPACPYAECNGRTFKNASRLREHLKVHAEREEDLAAGCGEDEDLPPVLQKRRRKRRRSEAEADTSQPHLAREQLRTIAETTDDGVKKQRQDDLEQPNATSATANAASDSLERQVDTSAQKDGEKPTRPAKLPRLPSGTAGKDWPCGAPGCHKAFKTKFARDEHSQAAHAKGKHRCDVCGRAYRRPASLKRHQAEGWCQAEQGEGKISDDSAVTGAAPDNEAAQDRIAQGANDSGQESTFEKNGYYDGMAAELLGTATAPGGRHFRPWVCPYGTHVALHAEAETAATTTATSANKGREAELHPPPLRLPQRLAAEQSAEKEKGKGVQQGQEKEVANEQVTREDEDGVEVASEAESEKGDDDVPCEERFFRIYDVRRHLRAAHGVDLGDWETRELLLTDGQRGD